MEWWRQLFDSRISVLPKRSRHFHRTVSPPSQMEWWRQLLDSRFTAWCLHRRDVGLDWRSEENFARWLFQKIRIFFFVPCTTAMNGTKRPKDWLASVCTCKYVRADVNIKFVADNLGKLGLSLPQRELFCYPRRRIYLPYWETWHIRCDIIKSTRLTALRTRPSACVSAKRLISCEDSLIFKLHIGKIICNGVCGSI